MSWWRRVLIQPFGAAGSLQRTLSATITGALLLAVAMSVAVAAYEFLEHLEEAIEISLTREAYEVLTQADVTRPHYGFDPESLRFRGDGGVYRYTIFGPDLAPVAGEEDAPEIRARLADLPTMIPVRFDFSGRRAGIGLCMPRDGVRVCALATGDAGVHGRSTLGLMLEEVGEQMQWIVLGAIVVLVAAILATRLSLRPLDRVLREARDIGPDAPELRLSAEGLATEIVPLVGAVNAAFDRLEKGYRAQAAFSSNVAHEVRTPLAVLRSSVDHIAEPELRNALKADLRRLETVFEQLIDLARADALVPASFEPVDLHALALQVSHDRALVAIRAGRTLAVTGTTGVSVRGHAGLLAIALDNLVRNALDFAPEGSEVEIEIAAAPPRIRVLDRGAGIPAGDREVLFERFRRGPGRHEGAGIGLAIVKAVAEAHGATVRIEDRPGGGTAFVLAFAPV